MQLTANVLIVDARKSVRLMIRDLLEQAQPGYLIADAATGHSAMAVAIQHRPRVIVISHSLRDTDGLELIARIRRELSGTAVIALTESHNILNIAKVICAGAFACVHMSRIEPELITLTKHILSRSGSTADAGDPR